MDVAIAKPHPLHAHMCLVTLTRVIEEHMLNYRLFGPCVQMYAQTHIHTNVRTYEPYYIFKWVNVSNSLCPSIILNFFYFRTLSLYTQMGRGITRRNPVHATPKSGCICIPFLSFSLQWFVGQSTIFGLFGA